jgi:hypothetical protein
MTRFTPKLISTDNWNQIIFDFSQFGYSQLNNKIYCFPDDELLRDLLFPWGWNPPERYGLKNYLNPRNPSDRSLSLCQSYSNCTINNILLRYSDPLRSIRLSEKYIKNICENRAIPYDYIELLHLVSIYLDWMYPPPIDFKKSWYSIVPFSSVMKVEDITSEVAKKAFDKRSRWGNMLASRFPQWADSFEMSKRLFDEMKLSDEYPDAIETMVKGVEAMMKGSRKLKQEQKGLAKGLAGDFSIRQCWFCGEFYLSPISSNNNYSRYCPNEYDKERKCKKSHNAWINCLKRKGESPSSLGL